MYNSGNVSLYDLRQESTPFTHLLDDMGLRVNRPSPYGITGNEQMFIILCDSPKESLAVIKEIRGESLAPIMVLYSRYSELENVLALEKGADLCLGADMGQRELRARIKALGRHTSRINESENSTLTNGVISMDTRRRAVFRGGECVPMTATEYGILEYLLSNVGDVCPVEEIYRNVWHEKPFSIKKTVVEHIRRIRCKLEPDPHRPSYIKAVTGVGYCMVGVSNVAV